MRRILFAIVLMFFLLGCTASIEPKISYDIYPDTEDAPVLNFYWDGEIEADNIERITPYGVWEGSEGIYEPAVEMQFYTFTHGDPVYAVTAGTVTDVTKKWKSLAVRYGRNYVVTYHHIETVDGLSPGDKIEEEQLIGHTEHLNGLGWWEVELNVKRGNVFRTVPPFDYFSKESQEKLMFILKSAKYSYEHDSWTIREDDSWIKEIGSDEWWSSSYRMGYRILDEESVEDFIKANNMSHILGSYR